MKKIALSINLDWPLYRYHELYRGVQTYARENTDWKVIWDHYPEYALRRSGSTPYYDGIIGRIKKSAWQEVKHLNIPVVNTWYSSDLKNLPSVLINYKKTGSLAAQHLMERGINNFIVFCHDKKNLSRDFIKGIKSAIQDKNYTIKCYQVRNDTSDDKQAWAEFCKLFSSWTKKWTYPVGIACTSSSLGPKITTRLKANNINMPEDALVISAGNDPAYCEITQPQITSVNQDYFNVGYESARMLHQQLEGSKPNFKRIFISPLGISSRESTDFYGFKNAYLTEALRFIADNYKNRISYKDVIANVTISRRNLDSLFKKFMGHSVMDEIYRLRIEALKRLLKESDRPMNQLYLETGFNNPTHMRRVFTRYVGQSPSEFRRDA